MAALLRERVAAATAAGITPDSASSGDRRYERYWQLLAIINGWPAAASGRPAAEWPIAALRRGRPLDCRCRKLGSNT
jgi:hypothetical protein